MRLYEKPAAMLAEISLMRRAESDRREDRATVSAFFNGQPPITDAEAEAQGLTMNVNHLFGYTELRDLRDQLVSLHTKPAKRVEIELDSAPNGKRLDWSLKASLHASEVLSKNRSFKGQYVGAAGDATMHGEAVFFYGTTSNPCPKQVPLSRLLVSDGAPTDAQALTHFAIEDILEPYQLATVYRKRFKYWKSDAVRLALKAFYKDAHNPGEDQDAENWEELEYRRQENSSMSVRRRGIPVVYFFQQRLDEDGPPYDLTILRKWPDANSKEDAAKADASVLFERERMYPRASCAIHPFFVDCILGGSAKWHRVMGVGTLNYQLNVATELLINRGMQATWEATQNLWVAKDAATRENIQKILVRHNGVIPENVELLQQRYQPNFAGVLEMIQFFRQQGGRNARGPTLNQGDKNDLLEVQAIADQNRTASQTNMAAGEWYDHYDGLCEEDVARLANPFIEPREQGYSMVMDFQSRMEREGIPLYWIQPHNIRVRATRLIGDGLRSKELAAAQGLEASRQFLAPEVQPLANRLILALRTDNYRLAEEMVPQEQKPDTNQIHRALGENAIMLTQPDPLGPMEDDIDEVHAPAHMKALEHLIMKGVQDQQTSFTEEQAQSFKNIGGHTLAHIQRIEAKAEPNKNDHNRQLARALTDQLNQYAALGEKLVNNMQQQQEAQQQQSEPMSQAEQAKLQLSVEQLRLQREKLQFSQEKFARQQGNREQALAFTQMISLEQNQREGQRMLLEARSQANEHARKDVETAVKVKQANKPATLSP